MLLDGVGVAEKRKAIALRQAGDEAQQGLAGILQLRALHGSAAVQDNDEIDAAIAGGMPFTAGTGRQHEFQTDSAG